MFKVSKRITQMLSLIVLILFCVSCMHIPGGVAASNVPIDGRTYQVVGETKGRDSQIRLLGIFPISGANLTRTAMRDAINNKNADALINVSVDFYMTWWVLWGSSITVVNGSAIKFTNK